METIDTQRLTLRPWQISDAEALFKYASHPDVGPRAGWPPHKSIEESREIIRSIFSNNATWAITLKSTGEAIGCIGYYTQDTSNIAIGPNDAEIGYWIGQPHWNQGYCTEALSALVAYCLASKHFDSLWCDHFVDNPASGRVMEKCGFTDTGRINHSSRLAHCQDRPIRIMRLTEPSKIQ